MSEQVTVIAKFRAKQGTESRVREFLQTLIKPTRAEAGCMNYDLHESLENPREFLLHENWASAAQLDAHLKAPHIADAFKLAPQLLDGDVEITRWRPVR
jgi:quinol monooxygenase YgiN